jgi:hypothetical protein
MWLRLLDEILREAPRVNSANQARLSEDVLAGRGGARISWRDVPASVQHAVEVWSGHEISAVEARAGGFSPGVAAILTTSDGRRVFVKAAGPTPNEYAPRIHRREIAISQQLPASKLTPHLLWSLDDAQTGWVVLIFREIDGAPPHVPWRRHELERVVHGLGELADVLTPSPLPASVAGDLAGSGLLAGYWKRLTSRASELERWCAEHLDRLIDLEDQAASATAGDTLVHLDVRADNVLLTRDAVSFVDWPHARRAAGWFDLLFFAPSVAMQGGPAPDDLLALYPRSLPSHEQLLPALAVIAGFFTWGALQPPEPGLPFLRQFQDAQGVVARRWLAGQLGTG